MCKQTDTMTTTNGTANGTTAPEKTTMKKGDGDDSSGAPLLLRFWRSVLSSLPEVRLFGLDVRLTLATAILLTGFRYASEYVQIVHFGWPADSVSTKLAAASVVAMFHSINLVPSLAACFLSHPASRPGEHIGSSPGRWWTEAVDALLQFCTGYMIYDGLINIVLLKWDVGMDSADRMFLGHHMATTFYMTATRVYGAGHVSAMICMFLGECTNPFHNGYYIAIEAMKHDCCNGPLMTAYYAAVECCFVTTYCVVRAVVAPLILIHTTYDLWTTGRKQHLPVWILSLFTFLIWGVVFGSAPWIQECWEIFLTKYNPLSSSSVAAPEAHTEL